MQNLKLDDKKVVLASVIAWAVGLVAFFLPFFKISAFGMGVSFSGFGLMTGIGLGDMADGMPFNFYLWLGCAAGIAGLVLSILCFKDWDKEKDTPKPLIAAICGAVGLLCLLAFMSVYGSSSELGYIKSFLKVGFGRILAILAYIVAAVAIIAPRYLLPLLNKDQAQAPAEPAAPVAPAEPAAPVEPETPAEPQDPTAEG